MTDSEFKFDFNRITYDEIQQLALLTEGEQEEISLGMLERCIVSWPYEGKITKANIRKLGMLNYIKLQKAFTAELEALFRPE